MSKILPIRIKSAMTELMRDITKTQLITDFVNRIKINTLRNICDVILTSKVMKINSEKDVKTCLDVTERTSYEYWKAFLIIDEFYKQEYESKNNIR